jgi:DNA repair exonuclease SbcCD nuclease subunit
MKIGVIGDLHLTNHRPERRKDDYFQTLLGKLKQAMDIFRREGIEWVIQVGDFFDTPTVANRVKAGVLDLLRQYEQKILCVYGQHDITGHSAATLPNSPLAVLQAAGVAMILGRRKIDNLTVVYGASFGEGMPSPHPDDLNILVTHQMIGNRPLYPGQPLESPRVFLRKHPEYNLVICGDYHYPFQDSYDGRLIVNAGAIPRKTITDVDLGLQPSVLTIDLETMNVETHQLDVADASEVFDLTREVKPEKDEAALQRLVEDLRNSHATKTGWQTILLRLLEERGVDESVNQVLDEAMNEVNPYA